MQALNNFEHLNDKLDRHGAAAGAAECHGFVCAQLCLMGQLDRQAWHDSLIPPDADHELLENELQNLGSDAHKQFEAHDFSFELLLPADEAPIGRRLEALAEWCRGFLFGLGSSGLTEAGLAGNCREIVNDMERISRVSPDTDTAGEEGEFALMELIEYVRIGALSIYQELRAGRRHESPESGMH